ncbi:MAG: HK97 gp10 family phage protein [Clostridium sp.]|uniref:HK97 gp10 family phage protein n=1 Tax=Clostridia TaxID=186801 RepID=UPI003F3C053F
MKIINNVDEFEKKFMEALKSASKEICITELADIQSNTPVLTGDLKRSITGKSKVKNNLVKIEWGSKLVYARKVEFKDKSYIRSTLTRDLDKIGKILDKHIGGADK